MASVYKRNGRGPWIIAWFDHTGKRRDRSSRTTDRRAAERIAAKLEADAALRRDGVIDARTDGYAAAERVPLSQHAGVFHKHLTQKGTGTKTLKSYRVEPKKRKKIGQG